MCSAAGNYVETYSDPTYGFGVTFLFNPTLYIDIDISYTFSIPTGINDLNVTLVCPE